MIPRPAAPLQLIERAVQDRAKQLALDMADPAAYEVLEGLVEAEIERWRDDHRRGARHVDIAEPRLVATRALRNLTGYGPLQPLLDDPDVWEVMQSPVITVNDVVGASDLGFRDVCDNPDGNDRGIPAGWD